MLKRWLAALLAVMMVFALVPGAVFADTAKEDFVIKNGVLKKYTGNDAVVVVPDGVTEIGQYAFYKNKTVKEVVLPDTVKVIRDYAFSCCSYLKKINLPKGLQEIGWQAFCRNYYLDHIVIPDSVTRLEGCAFYRCDRLSNLIIPKTLIDFEDSTFNTTLWYKNTYANQDFHILNHVLIGISDAVKQQEKVVIPNGVVSIRSRLFTEYNETNTKIKEVVLPNSLREIGDSFCGLAALERIRIPSGVHKIGAAFKECKCLREIVIPEGVTEIATGTFRDCIGLEKVVLPSTLVKIGNRAFDFCKNLNEITIPNSVTEIGNSAFSCCYALERIVLPEGLTTLGYSAFWNCEKLSDITIPSSLKDIGHRAFSLTPWLTKKFQGKDAIIINGVILGCKISDNNFIYIPDGVTSIAMDGGVRVKGFVIPPTVTNMDHFDYFDGRIQAFYGVPGSYAEQDVLKNQAKFIPLAINQTAITLKKGSSQTLYFNSGSTAVWKSSNLNIVTVDQNGKITAKKAGTATITATLYGKDYTCKVTVGAKTYTVKRGDTLWSIAAKQLGSGTRYTEIMKLNDLNSTVIHAGKKLYLPEK